MAIKHASHRVYVTKYHRIWAPPYLKWAARGDRTDFAKKGFADSYEQRIEIEAMEVTEDRFHIVWGIPPKSSISDVVHKFKAISGKVTFSTYPEVKGELWGGDFSEGAHFVRMVGNQVTEYVTEK